MSKQHIYTSPKLLWGIIIVLVFAVGYAYYALSNLSKAHAALQASLYETQVKLDEKEREMESMSVVLAELNQKYALSEENSAELLERLQDEQDRNEDFEDQIKDISGVVGDLDKLAKTDPELLMKYSKVFFLNEHYAPSRFDEIPDRYVWGSDEGEVEHVDANIAPFLEDLLEDAKDDDISLYVASAFRSHDEQGSLKGAYTVWYGTGANTFSADQGYSEHQLGTTIDFTTDSLNGAIDGFENTEAYDWLLENAYKYGFVLSYPEGNAYYVYEPWHWRFVGRDLARYLDRNDKYFYDLDQRKIDEYLISIFD